MHDCSKSGSNDEEDVWFDVLDEPERYEHCSGTLFNTSVFGFVAIVACALSISLLPASPAHDAAMIWP